MNMKGLSEYETPDIEILMINTEGVLCSSATEALGENEGDWGW